MKSSAELCAELAIKDVDLEWSDADYQNLTTYNMFVRMARPQLFSVRMSGTCVEKALERTVFSIHQALPLYFHIHGVN